LHSDECRAATPPATEFLLSLDRREPLRPASGLRGSAAADHEGEGERTQTVEVAEQTLEAVEAVDVSASCSVGEAGATALVLTFSARTDFSRRGTGDRLVRARADEFWEHAFVQRFGERA
jgi:hypothetical protein